mgnify:CR=1 FL=1
MTSFLTSCLGLSLSFPSTDNVVLELHFLNEKLTYMVKREITSLYVIVIWYLEIMPRGFGSRIGDMEAKNCECLTTC